MPWEASFETRASRAPQDDTKECFDTRDFVARLSTTSNGALKQRKLGVFFEVFGIDAECA